MKASRFFLLILSFILSVQVCLGEGVNRYALAPSHLKTSPAEMELAFRVESILHAWRAGAGVLTVRQADTQAQLALARQGSFTGDVLIDFSTLRPLNEEGSVAAVDITVRNASGNTQTMSVVLLGATQTDHNVLVLPFLFGDKYGDVCDRGYGFVQPTLESPREAGTEIPADFDVKLQEQWQAILDEDLANEPDLQKRAIAFAAVNSENRVQRGPFQMCFHPQLVANKRKAEWPETIIAYDHQRPEKFDFTKVTNPREELARLKIRNRKWRVLTNKYPWLNNHALLVSETWRPQILLPEDVLDFLTLQKHSRVRGMFNGWGAGASVNHMHIQTFMNENNLPIDRMNEISLGSVGDVQLGTLEHPANNIVFRSTSDIALALEVGKFVQELRARQIPHDVLFLGDKVVVFPMNIDPKRDRDTALKETKKLGVMASLEMLGTLASAPRHRGQLLEVRPASIGKLFEAFSLEDSVFLNFVTHVFNGQVANKLETFLRSTKRLVPDLRPHVLDGFDERFKSQWDGLLAKELATVDDPKDRALAFPPPGPEDRIACGPYTLLHQPEIGLKPVPPGPDPIVAESNERGNFDFTRLKGTKEDLGPMVLNGHDYRLFTNKYDRLPHHAVLASEEWRPQVLFAEDVLNFMTLQQKSKIRGFFNGYGAAASVNHFHIQTYYDEGDSFIDRLQEIPLGRSGSVDMSSLDHPAANLVFRSTSPGALAQTVGRYVAKLRQQRIPHNVLFLGDRVVVFPQSQTRSSDSSISFPDMPKLLPIACLELMGYVTPVSATKEGYDRIKPEKIGEMMRAKELEPDVFVQLTREMLGQKVSQKLQQLMRNRSPLVPILKPSAGAHLENLRKLGYELAPDLIKDATFDTQGMLTFKKRLKDGTGFITYKFENSQPFELNGSINNLLALLKENPPEQLRYLVFKRIVKYRAKASDHLDEIRRYLDPAVEPSAMVRDEVAVAINMIEGRSVQNTDRLNIVHITYEAEPLIKKGGLADVSGTLPRVFENKGGHNAAVIMPYWAVIDQLIKDRPDIKPHSLNISVSVKGRSFDIYSVVVDGTPMYLLRNDDYFDVEGEMQIGGRTVKIAADDIYRVAADRAYQDANTGNGKRYSMHPKNAETAILFSHAAIKAMEALSEKGLMQKPDIINTCDWQSGLVPALLKESSSYRDSSLKGTKVEHTIHNLPYKGLFAASPWSQKEEERRLWDLLDLPEHAYMPEDMMGVEFFGNVSLAKAGIVYSDKRNTVSPEYAKLIQTDEGGSGFGGLLRAKGVVGIINANARREINYAHSPGVYVRSDHPLKEADKAFGVVDIIEGKRLNRSFASRYFGINDRSEQRIPLFAFVGRLEDEKGLQFLMPVVERLLREKKAQFVFTGKGADQHMNTLKRLMQEFPGEIVHTGFVTNNELQLIYAAHDALNMPSLQEPCGLSHLQAMRFGGIPLANDAGGLHDTVFDFDAAGEQGNGYLIHLDRAMSLGKDEAAKHELGIRELWTGTLRVLADYHNVPLWESRVRQTYAQSGQFNWEESARQYETLFREALNRPAVQDFYSPLDPSLQRFVDSVAQTIQKTYQGISVSDLRNVLAQARLRGLDKNALAAQLTQMGVTDVGLAHAYALRATGLLMMASGGGGRDAQQYARLSELKKRAAPVVEAMKVTFDLMQNGKLKLTDAQNGDLEEFRKIRDMLESGSMEVGEDHFEWNLWRAIQLIQQFTENLGRENPIRWVDLLQSVGGRITDRNIRRALIENILSHRGAQFEPRLDILGVYDPFGEPSADFMFRDEIAASERRSEALEQQARSYIADKIIIDRFVRTQFTFEDMDILTKAIDRAVFENTVEDILSGIFEIPRSTFFMAAKENPGSYASFLLALQGCKTEGASMAVSMKVDNLLGILSPFAKAKSVQPGDKTTALLSHALEFSLKSDLESTDSRGAKRSLIDDVQNWYMRQYGLDEPKMEGLPSLLCALYERGYYPDIETDGFLAKWPDREKMIPLAIALLKALFKTPLMEEGTVISLGLEIYGRTFSLSVKKMGNRPLAVIRVLPPKADLEPDRFAGASA